MKDDGWSAGQAPDGSRVQGPALTPPVIERIEAVRAYLHEHLAEPITLATLSRVAALSPYYLVRVFKAHVGAPPHRYLTGLRVERARQLLEVTSLSVTQVAHRAGFATVSHFSTVFRSRVGLSPTDYRRRHLRTRWTSAELVEVPLTEAALA
jgi:AraC-like DNA-binding protein